MIAVESSAERCKSLRKSLTKRRTLLRTHPRSLLGLSRELSPRSREPRPCDARLSRYRKSLARAGVALALGAVFAGHAGAGEPDPKSYWDVSQIRPG